MAIPDTKLRNAKPKPERYRLSAGDNLYLEVMPTGLKVWRMRFNDPSTRKPGIYTIGQYPALSQPEARQAAYAAKQLVRQGINPTRHRESEQQRTRQEQEAALRARSDSFESVARAWHQHRQDSMKKWTPGHAEKILRSLEADVFPALGQLHIAEVTAPCVLDVIQAVVDKGNIETAKKLNQRINAIFRYAVTRRMVAHNEADNIKDELPTASRRHNPHLQADEIPAFIR
ncbi:MAG: integrase arm-type DNA-binding domain-containing protein [Thiothrix sp.]|nr:integrase arm-type DNA-binding domain-containing protein [Thiothrix sp.]HPQ97143.1 integrase arm-type DNA-binding domain-containing protein [Thiolinea sp.]